MDSGILEQTVERLAIDCIELIQATQTENHEGLKSLCHMYLLFLDKRYKIFSELKRESIFHYGLSYRVYYEAMLRETEDLMGMLLRQEHHEIKHQSLLVVALSYALAKQYLMREKVTFEPACNELPHKMMERVQYYILNNYNLDTTGEMKQDDKVIHFF